MEWYPFLGQLGSTETNSELAREAPDATEYGSWLRRIGAAVDPLRSGCIQGLSLCFDRQDVSARGGRHEETSAPWHFN